MDERPGNSSDNKATTTAAPVAAPRAPVAHGPSACDPGLLVGEAKNIAEGVASLATHFRGQQIPGWQAGFRRAGSILLALSAVIGALFGLEQFLASRQETARTETETLFSAAMQQLASPQPALQAAAVRSLPRIATFRDVPRPEPGEYVFGSYLINRFVRSRREFPLMQQSWMLFREFASQSRMSSTANPSTGDIVSSAILLEGAAWEMRRRTETRVTDEGTGSLLYKANLPNAHGIDQDFRRINFGAVDLRNADLSASKFDDCGLSGARLDGAILRGASLKSAYLAEARMQNADFSFAVLDGAVVKHAMLQGAKFTQTFLVRADFTDSTLDKATFSQAIVHHAIFKNASLRGAVFEQTDVSFALFEGADVEGADFTTSIGFTNATLSGARNVKEARLPKANATK